MEVLSDVLTGIGVMSGTSIDGLDLICVTFYKSNNKICYDIHASETIPYSITWKNNFLHSTELSALDLRKLDVDFSHFMSDAILSFLKTKSWKPDYISSHGHTVFHQPKSGFTLQIGCGATLAALTGIQTISDFRQSDVALGGQGAPLVPIGDQILFSEYTYCLNLGGFSNVSYEINGSRIAFDISPLNVVLNNLARRLGVEYDDEGKLADTGKIIPELFDKLNKLDYYQNTAPKSLGTEWVEEFISPLLTQFAVNHEIGDLLNTFGSHFAYQIGKVLKSGKTLVTGGGAKNSWLLKQIKLHSMSTMELPSGNLIDNKEALIFALLGYLRLKEIPNTLPSVTGASRPISAGAIYKG
jgi:anhydro-N-acetylmuramic acid kinase